MFSLWGSLQHDGDRMLNQLGLGSYSAAHTFLKDHRWSLFHVLFCPTQTSASIKVVVIHTTIIMALLIGESLS